VNKINIKFTPFTSKHLEFAIDIKLVTANTAVKGHFLHNR